MYSLFVFLTIIDVQMTLLLFDVLKHAVHSVV